MNRPFMHQQADSIQARIRWGIVGSTLFFLFHLTGQQDKLFSINLPLISHIWLMWKHFYSNLREIVVCSSKHKTRVAVSQTFSSVDPKQKYSVKSLIKWWFRRTQSKENVPFPDVKPNWTQTPFHPQSKLIILMQTSPLHNLTFA